MQRRYICEYVNICSINNVHLYIIQRFMISLNRTASYTDINFCAARLLPRSCYIYLDCTESMTLNKGIFSWLSRPSTSAIISNEIGCRGATSFVTKVHIFLIIDSLSLPNFKQRFNIVGLKSSILQFM